MSAKKKKKKAGGKKGAKPQGKQPKNIKRKAKSGFSLDPESLIGLALILLLCIAAYWPTFENGFTNWDDDLYVTENKNISKYQDDFELLMTDNIAANRHPLTMMTLSWDYSLTGVDPEFKDASYYHAQSLIWHLFNTVLTFIFIYLVTGKNKVIALTCAAVFALHPMHVESVAWVSGRKDVTYTFFFLLALISYWQYYKNRNWLLYGLAIVFTVLSNAAKPAAVIIPGVLILIDLVDRLRVGDFKNWINSVINPQLWLDKIPFIAISGGFAYLTIKSQGETAALKGGELFNIGEKFVFGTYAFFNYIYKFFAPVNLANFHAYPINPDGSPESAYLIFPVLFILALAGVFYSLTKNKIIFWGIGFYFITIVLVLQFKTVGSAITSERYTYVPYIGLAFILGHGIYQVLKKGSRFAKFKIPLLALCGLLILGSTYASHERVKDWKNSVTLWESTIKLYPTDPAARNNRGHAMRQLSETYEPNSKEWNECLDQAKLDYLQSIKSKPKKNARAYSNLGMIYYKRNEDSLALQAYNKSISQDPKYHEAYSNRGAIHARNKRFGKALKDFDKCIELNKTHKAVYLNRGILHSQWAERAARRRDTSGAMNEFRLALADYNSYVQLDPYNHGIYNSIAVTNQNLNNHATAIEAMAKALRLAPNNPDYYLNRAISYVLTNRKDLATKDVQKAKKLGKAPSPWLLDKLKK